MNTTLIDIRRLAMNAGQIEGVPANPRTITRDDIERMARSLRETPELFEMRPCIVKEVDGSFVILGGNLRYEGSKAAGIKDVPCVIVPESWDADKLRELVIKDNGSFGSWDFDALANEWDDLPLNDWGVPAWKMEEVDEAAVDALFTDATDKPGNDAVKVVIEIPKAYEDKVDDIRAAVRVTLDEWPGITLK